eukprot:4084103-Prymnesium_polylepis.2
MSGLDGGKARLLRSYCATEPQRRSYALDPVAHAVDIVFCWTPARPQAPAWRKGREAREVVAGTAPRLGA